MEGSVNIINYQAHHKVYIINKTNIFGATSKIDVSTYLDKVYQTPKLEFYQSNLSLGLDGEMKNIKDWISMLTMEKRNR